MKSSFKVIKNNSFLLWVFFVVSLVVVVANSKSQKDLFTFYVVINSVVFFILYQIFCITKATFILDEKTFSVNGLSFMFSNKERKIIIPFNEIIALNGYRRPYYIKLEIQLLNNQKINLYLERWSNKEENYYAFIDSFNERLQKIK
jgi:hypothetical protein